MYTCICASPVLPTSLQVMGYQLRKDLSTGSQDANFNHTRTIPTSRFDSCFGLLVSVAGYYQRYVSSTCVNGETVRQDSKSSTAPSSTTCGYHQQEVITLVLDWRFPPLGFINATWYQRALIGRPFDKIHKDSTAPNLTKIIKWSTMVCVWSTTVDIVSLVILWRWHDECDIICSTLLLYPGIFSLVLFELLENSFWCRGQLLLGFLASPRAIFTVGDKQGLYFTATAYSRYPLNVYECTRLTSSTRSS